MRVPKWSILGSPGKPGKVNQLTRLASRAKVNYLFGGLAGALGCHIGYIG